MMLPQAKKGLGPPETRRVRKGSSPRAFGENTAHQHLILDSWLPELLGDKLLLFKLTGLC